MKRLLILICLFAGCLLAQGTTAGSPGSVTFTAATVNPAQMIVTAGTGTSAVVCTVKGSPAIPAPGVSLVCQIGPAVVISSSISLSPGMTLPINLAWGTNESDLTITVPSAAGATSVVGTAKVNGTVVQTQTGTF